MADAGVLPVSRTERTLERLRTTAGVVAAVAGAITGMWTIYEKVKTDARQYTAASYETLAPQVNQMNEALRQLEADNTQLKRALLAHGDRPRVVARPKAPTKPGEAPPATPAVPAAGAPAPPPTPAQAQEQSDDALGRLAGTLNQTREAVEAVRKVPETFQKVLDSRGKK
jgi:hypothetical protein